QIEIQRRNTAARRGAPGQNEPRFAVRGRLKRQRLRRNADKRPEHVTHQHAPRLEPPPQPQTSQSLGPRALVHREQGAPRRVQLRHRVQIPKPHVSAIQLAHRFVRRAVNDESRCSSQDVQTNQLAVTSIVGEQSARCTASAIATSTSRGPSKRSLACAVRTLSTSIRSPACHRSRMVLASYTLSSSCTTSAPTASPLPKRVLNGSPSSP